jgi:hypothetical protein
MCAASQIWDGGVPILMDLDRAEGLRETALGTIADAPKGVAALRLAVSLNETITLNMQYLRRTAESRA